MPKSLRIHANERVDLDDFNLAATDYTRNLSNLLMERFALDRKPNVLDGFRIEIADQSTNPGQITIYNGTAFDRSGQLVHIEDQPEASLALTLSGANQSFYIEIQFTETESDVDSRGFWDPTVDNADPIPDGAEAILSVATRNTSSWSIVTPVSTTAFDLTNNPNSTRIPLAILNTDGTNRIDSSVNGFTSLVTASTVLEADSAASAVSLKVVDSRLFPVGSVVTVDYGGASPEVTRTVTINDYANNIITISPLLSSAHLAGAIVTRTGVTATFLPETTDPNSPDFLLTVQNQPNDRLRRIWQGDETHGSGLLSSKYTAGARDDLNLRSLKDYIDSTAATIREMKFGSFRASDTSAAPPFSFATRPRHLDPAGSITGARTNTISIGNGTTTFGDFNGTTDAVFTAALAALPATGGTIFVKAGTYTFANTVAITNTSNIIFSGEGRDAVFIVANAPLVGAFSLVNGAEVMFENMAISGTATYSFIDSGAAATYKLLMDNSTTTGFRANTDASSVANVELRSSVISGAIDVSTITGYIEKCGLINCTITGKLNKFVLNGNVINNTNMSFVSSTSCIDTVFYGCSFTGSLSAATQTMLKLAYVGPDEANLNCVIDSCTINVTTTFAPTGYAYTFIDADTFVNLKITDCVANINATLAGSSDNVVFLGKLDSNSGCSVSNCSIFANAVTGQTGGFYLSTGGTDVFVSGCFFAVNIGLDVTVATEVKVSDCLFNAMWTPDTQDWYGILAKATSSTPRISVSDCIFYNTPSYYNTGHKYGISVTNSFTSTFYLSKTHLIASGNVFLGLSAPVSKAIFCSIAYGIVDINNNYVDGSTNTLIQAYSTTCTVFDVAVTEVAPLQYPSIVNICDNKVYRYYALPNATFINVTGPNETYPISFKFSGNTIANIAFAAATVDPKVLSVTNATAVISGNTIDQVSSTSNLVGINVGSACHNSAISSNVIQNLSASAGSCKGIFAATMIGGIISDNVVTKLNGTTVRFIDIQGFSEGLAIQRNRITTAVSTPATVTAVNGIYAVSVTSSTLSGNSIGNLEIAAATVTGINSSGISNYCSINDNTITNLTGTTVKGVDAAGNSSMTVSGNTVQALAGSTACYGIFIDAAGGSVANNVVYDVGSTAGTGIRGSLCNNVSFNGNSIKSFKIGVDISGSNSCNVDSNSLVLNSASAGSYGIYLASAGDISSISICSNNIEIVAGQANAIAVSADTLSATISNNTISRSTSATARGILVVCAGSVSVCGNTLVGISGSTGVSISAMHIACTTGNVCNNLVKDWYVSDCVYNLAFTRGVVSGNTAVPLTALTGAYYDYMGSLNANVIAIGNVATSTNSRSFTVSPTILAGTNIPTANW